MHFPLSYEVVTGVLWLDLTLWFDDICTQNKDIKWNYLIQVASPYGEKLGVSKFYFFPFIKVINRYLLFKKKKERKDKTVYFSPRYPASSYQGVSSWFLFSVCSTCARSINSWSRWFERNSCVSALTLWGIGYKLLGIITLMVRGYFYWFKGNYIPSYCHHSLLFFPDNRP